MSFLTDSGNKMRDFCLLYARDGDSVRRDSRQYFKAQNCVSLNLVHYSHFGKFWPNLLTGEKQRDKLVHNFELTNKGVVTY